MLPTLCVWEYFMSILRRGRSHSVLRHTLAMSGPLQRIEKQKWDWVAAS